jgi:HEAT repeat protein
LYLRESYFRIVCFLAISLVAFPLSSQEASQDQLNAIEASRLATINYGTETEIAALIQTLKGEGADYLDKELIALLEKTRNQKILSGIFSFFGDREKSGLEDRAIKAISDRDFETNETVFAAVEYLGKVKAGQAEPALKELLDSKERRFMNAAFRALGRVGGVGEAGGAVAEFLIDYYENRDPGDENRRDIIQAIGETRSPSGLSFLSEIANNNDEKGVLRMAALEALAKIGDPAGLEAILAALGSSDPNVRSSAVAALGPFSGEDVDNAILEAFRDSYYRTRIAAAQASRERKLVSAVPYLKFRAERDDVPQVKDEAIRALGAIGNSETLGILKSLFTERKNPERVRLAAAQALMENAAGENLDQLVTELDEAKQKNQTPLYNGFLKILGEARCGNIENVTRRLMVSGGIIEKSYALDMAANNMLLGLSEEIKTIKKKKNESLARKARRTMEKLGMQ